MKIADKLADLWLLAIQSRLDNQEATPGYSKHRRWLEAMYRRRLRNFSMIRDAIERSRIHESTILLIAIIYHRITKLEFDILFG